MFLVGLTGGVGTGKSTTAKMFRELGVPIVDCDLIAKRIVEPGRPAWKKIKVHDFLNYDKDFENHENGAEFLELVFLLLQ